MVKEPHREADRRIRGATHAIEWGIGAVIVVSPQTHHITALERLFGFRHSKSLELPGDGPCALAGNQTWGDLWVGCENGDLIRLTNAELQPEEVARVNLGRKIPWVAMGFSVQDSGRKRDTSGRRQLQSPSPDPDTRVALVRSDLLTFAPSPTGIRVFNNMQPGIAELGEIQGVPSYEAGAFDPISGCLFLASASGEGAVVRVNGNNSLTTLAMLSFPQVQGAIQARVVNSVLHVICERRNRWLSWDITDPENPVLAADDTYDQGLYWERNPVRWVRETGELLRRSGSWLDFVPADLPITVGGTAYQYATDEPFRWALHGEIGQLTWDQRRGVLPFRVFNSGGHTNAAGGGSKIRDSGPMLRPAGSIAGPWSPPISVETPGGQWPPVTEAAAFDANDEEVFSAHDERINTLLNAIPVSYYDCIEGKVVHNGDRSEQYPSDGTNIVRTKLPFRYDPVGVDNLRARVSAGAIPTFTTSVSGFFQNPADPIVTITRYYSDENRFVVVELAAAVPVGRVITIQESWYPSGTAENTGFIRETPPQVTVTIRPNGQRVLVPGAYNYALDSEGHGLGTYRVRWVSGTFFDPVTNKFFVFKLNAGTRIVARNLAVQPWSAASPFGWPDLDSMVADAALTAAAAEALAAAQTCEFTLTNPAPNVAVRPALGLEGVPVGCTGSVVLSLELLTPFVPWPP